MAEKAAAKGWTDAEKVGLFLQIITRAGPIPWPELNLPEGRTMKACQVMVDKEKQKMKKAREAAGEDVSDLTSPMKRKAADTEGGKAKKGRKSKVAADEGDDNEPAPGKKAKGGKKKASKAQAEEDVVLKEENAEDDE
ncbi:hypothetical protein Q7P35_008571 [Cladosporium inversicolor]